MKSSFLSLFLCLLTIGGISQSKWYRYNWKGVNSSDFPNLKKDVHNYCLKAYRDNIYVGKYYEVFSSSIAHSAQTDINFGYFYHNFDADYNNYLRKVLETVINDTSVTNKIRIYVCYDQDFNASMDGGGILRLNIGFLNGVENEAELASVMAHEAAHFINDDQIKHYGQRIEAFYRPPTTVFWGFAVYGIPVITFQFKRDDILWYNRADESAADFKAINFLKKSPYSLKGMADMLKKFKNAEIKNEIMHGESSEANSTHPDPGDRLKQVKILAGDTTNKKKKLFVVSSDDFYAMKERAYCESVNYSFESNQLNQLIESSFKNYLFEPDNNYNLAILNEALRRTLLFKGSDMWDKSFILSRYQTKNVRRSKNYEFLNEGNVSILKHLSKGFIGINKNDLANIKAKELVDTSVIEFTTNLEAYFYFQKKTAEKNNLLAQYGSFFPAVVDSVKASKKSGEKKSQTDSVKVKQFMAVNDLFDTNAYLEMLLAKPDTANRDLFIVLPTLLSQQFGFINQKSYKEQEQFYDSLYYVIKEKAGANTKKFSQLSFYDQHLLNSLYTHGRYFLNLENDKDVMYKADKTDWFTYLPEVYNLFKKNNVANIYLVDVNLYLDKDKKSFQKYSFYKLSLPNGKTSSFSASIKSGIQYLDGTYKWFYKKLANDFGYFYKQSRVKLSQ